MALKALIVYNVKVSKGRHCTSGTTQRIDLLAWKNTKYRSHGRNTVLQTTVSAEGSTQKDLTIQSLQYKSLTKYGSQKLNQCPQNG